jgi:hypothetical protein
MQKQRLILLTGLIVAAAGIGAVVTRLVPHEWNFTPMLAIALFAGATFRNKWLAFGVPLVLWVISDIALGFASYGWGTFTTVTPAIYLSVVLAGVIGLAVGRKRTAARIGGGALGSAVAFFLVTNFAVWLGSTMYPLTLTGLGECYWMALPFFRGTLAGTVGFSAVLFGSLALAERGMPALRPQSPAVA